MQRIDGRPVHSATDLVGFLACRYLTELEHAALRGMVKRPVRNDPALDRIRKRGDEHERRYLETLVADGRRVTTLKIPEDAWGLDRGGAIREAANATREAILRGDDVIYQACFFDGTWLGYADFLLRVDQPTDTLPWRYEVVDTKLARSAKASALLQICSYVDQLAPIQGAPPELVHVALGGSKREIRSYRTDDLMAYYRRAKADYLAAVAGDPDPGRADLYPDPVGHCDVCRWAAECSGRRRSDDDLSLVAGIGRRTRRELRDDRALRTRRSLAGLALPMVPPLRHTGADALGRVRRQASIQVRGQDQGANLHDLLLPPARTQDGSALDTTKGLVSLPEPRPGDLFLDLEGDPFAFDDGIDYLFGILELVPGGEPVFHDVWSRDADGRVTLAGEKAAFERTIDFIMQRLEADPSIHVYHYAAYERTAFGRLMGRHATREQAVDQLFRGGVLVDLYRVVQQSLIASVESYSIKKLEPFYGYRRERDLRDANSAIAAFEAWLEDGGEAGKDESTLQGIAEYNEDDVRSTWWLRDWLEHLRAEELAPTLPHPVPRPAPPETKEGADADALLSETDQVVATLTAGLPQDPAAIPDDDRPRWLLAQLLGWHRREAKAGYWRYFFLRDQLTDEQRVEEKEPMGMLSLVGPVPGEDRTYRYAFPEQEHDIKVGRSAIDPDPTVRMNLNVRRIDDAQRLIELHHPVRKNGDATIRHPRSLVPSLVVPTDAQQRALLEIGRSVAATGLTGPGPHQAARDLLQRARPRVGEMPWAPLIRPGEDTLRAARRLATALDLSHLAIQGPPGSGKTYTGARMILDLVKAGRRVGVTANSHKVIGNLLDAVAEAARADGRSVRIGQNPGGKENGPPTCTVAVPLKDNGRMAQAIAGGEVDVVGGTAWAWSADALRDAVDVLVIDEAGQFSLANALAVSVAAKSLVLLGDPQQLDQVVQGSHPPGAERSALAHLLDGDQVIHPELGLFLEHTWRLHPRIQGYTSEAFYEGKLETRPGNERIGLRGCGELDGTGVRWVAVDHTDNETTAAEEVARVSAMVAAVLEPGVATWTDRDGATHPVRPSDIVIVAPYNTHRIAIEEALAAALGPEVGRGVRVGTVDKFQGQEAPISIYAMGSSSAEDAPRGMDFLYSLNRLNVATSRAKALSVVVASPALLRAACATPEQVRLVNALCRFAEVAEEQAGTAGAPVATA
ncbi:MAG: TM0106 family RecB-like putative nuclease [Chloroflexota bacterium]